MALLGWIFIRHVFAPFLPAEQLDSYVAGLIILAAAPCTAMVFVWSRLSCGDPYFTLSQVALNDVIMIFAFAPIVALLLGISAITVPWDTLFTSVVLYIVIPVILAQLGRKALLERGIGIRFNGQEKTNVWEYCVSEGWIRVVAGVTLDRKGNPMTLLLKDAIAPNLVQTLEGTPAQVQIGEAVSVKTPPSV